MEPTEQKNEITVVNEPWYKKGWRPAMAWAYVAIVLFDFIIAPTLMIMITSGTTAWTPLTLQAGGFFHIAMGAVLGVGSYTRGVEKQKRVENGIHS